MSAERVVEVLDFRMPEGRLQNHYFYAVRNGAGLSLCVNKGPSCFIIEGHPFVSFFGDTEYYF